MDRPFGFVVIDKPAGLTSHACVSRIRQVFGIRRVGHGGTLDPAVTGVLPIALGCATRLLPYLPGAKTYRGIIQLGLRTSTDDLGGDVIKRQDWPDLSFGSLDQCLDQFRGTIEQRPPQVSAVHVQGERAHKRARRGEVLEMPLRTISIHELQLLGWNQNVGQLEINVHCSAGSYIRSLARDLGETLRCGGCLAELRRTQALGFKEDQAVPLPDRHEQPLTPPPVVFPPLLALGHLPRLQLKEEEQESWRCGRKITANQDRYQAAPEPQPHDQFIADQMIVMLDCAGEVAGVACLEESSTLKPKVVFDAKG
ncbi:MAG: tRNA pseudouridine(55) synthase TruB [Prochlorococcaceae cyanobacterium ETNP18_MAG_17]|nr:tRNA pseudouridine(55) synthase TruB [Prochlorococcaceae cyanobacterium ETNP18_MAG_17]